MAKPNYDFEKRQRENAKKKKKDEKRMQKADVSADKIEQDGTQEATNTDNLPVQN